MMSLIWAYYPLMIAYCVWGILLYEIFNSECGPVGPGDDS